MKKRGELVFDSLVPWLIALGALVLIIVLYSVLSGKGNAALDFFKNLWRFGR